MIVANSDPSFARILPITLKIAFLPFALSPVLSPVEGLSKGERDYLFVM